MKFVLHVYFLFICYFCVPTAFLIKFLPFQAKNSQLIKYPLQLETHEKETSVLGLRFLVEPRHFSSGRLKIRCSASIGNLYWQSTEKSMEEDKPKPSPLPTQTPIYSNDVYEKDFRDTNGRWPNEAYPPGMLSNFHLP